MSVHSLFPKEAAGHFGALRSSLAMTRRIHSARFPSPATASIRAATSAGRRKAMTIVATFRFSGGRPMRRVVPDSIATVNSPSFSVAAY